MIIDRTFIDAELEERLQAAQALGSRLIVQPTLDDVDNLAGHIAAEANHCEEPRVRRALEACTTDLQILTLGLPMKNKVPSP